MVLYTWFILNFISRRISSKEAMKLVPKSNNTGMRFISMYDVRSPSGKHEVGTSISKVIRSSPRFNTKGLLTYKICFWKS